MTWSVISSLGCCFLTVVVVVFLDALGIGWTPQRRNGVCGVVDVVALLLLLLAELLLDAAVHVGAVDWFLAATCPSTGIVWLDLSKFVPTKYL